MIRGVRKATETAAWRSLLLVLALGLVLFAGLMVAACGDDEPTSTSATEETTETTEMAMDLPDTIKVGAPPAS